MDTILTEQQIERLDDLVTRTAMETPRWCLSRECREIAENWDLDAAALERWVQLEMQLERIPCETPAAAFRVLVDGTSEYNLATQIAAAREQAIASADGSVR